MKKLNNEKQLRISGGNYCSPLGGDPVHALLYCNGCSLGYTLESVLNGSIVNDPTSLLFRVCTD